MKKLFWQRLFTTSIASAALLVAGAIGSQSVAADSAKGVGTVNYVKGYGPAFWKKTASGLVPLGKTLKTGTSWKIFGMEQSGSDYLFDMGGGQMANSRYLDLYNENSQQALNATATIHYTAGYSIAVRATPNGAITNKKLRNATSWRVFNRAVVNGHTWYNLGGKQWFDATYANLTKETSRGAKTYTNGPKLQMPASVTLLPPSKGINTATITSDLELLVNNYRKLKGLKPLTRRADLAKFALRRANDESSAVNAHHGDWSQANHILPNGWPVYADPFFLTTPFSNVAENLAGAYANNSAQIADNMFTSWRQSPGHEKNMRGDFTYEGMGVVPVKSMGSTMYLAIQEFLQK
ncbi:CAP domain-containing protein [Lacticaseibacillus pabuli]|uniref:CAP domain-containing protein n=1 Tax=Lacticaseibacillus pabuli TaxID=3025672 RepID=A0ABY7WSB8_9LACO|nr:CAP domain-containing protein [Lacticaseibacillus sp. KACC 23028]WDF82631.1 CAP domain-containing protein [Lacticaseibacillus sp. KACC 23028]